MKKLVSLAMASTLMVTLLSGCNSSNENTSGTQGGDTGTSDQNGSTVTFKLGYNTTEDSVRGAISDEFKRVLNEDSGGRLDVEVYPSEALGSEQEQIEAVKIGAQDFSLPGGSAMSNVSSVYGAIALPFFTTGYDDLHEKVDGEFGEYWKKTAEENGYKLLSICDLGFAQVTNNKRPINSVEDMAGLKMRSPNEPVLIKSMEALGASVTTLPFTEIYLALQQGVVDGQFNPLDAIYQTKFYEVQDYLAITNIFCYNINFITSTKLWDSLSPEDQEIIQKAADAAKEVSREYYEKADQEYLEKMQDGFKEITEPDMTSFRQAVEPVYEEFAKQVPADFAEKFLQ